MTDVNMSPTFFFKKGIKHADNVLMHSHPILPSHISELTTILKL